MSRYLVCSTATKPEQVEMINNFVAEKCRVHPEFFGFGTMHPGYGNMETEIERVKGLGLHGIKLHPDFQEFNIDDPAALPMYEAIAAAGLPILFHTGDKFRPYSAPHRLAAIARQFPKLTALRRTSADTITGTKRPGVFMIAPTYTLIRPARCSRSTRRVPLA